MSFRFGSSASRFRAVVLGAWTIGLGSILVSGKYSLFIRARLWPLLLASLMMLVFFLLAMIIRPAHDGSGRIRAATWVRGGMLMLPLLCLSTLMSGAAASGLNSFALEKRSLGFSSAMDSMMADAGSGAAVIPGGNQLMSLGYLAIHKHLLAGKHVVVEGRVCRDGSLPDGQFALYRFVVICCAADAMPVEVVVKSPKSSALKNDGWVRIGGIFHYDDNNGKQTYFIQADQAAPIPPPDEPYLSPYQL